MNWPARKKLPLTVPVRITAFKPDTRQTRRGVRIPVLRHEKADIPPIRDRNITVHLDLHVVEVVNEILLVGNSLQERGLIIFCSSRLFAPYPSVAMTEMKVARQDRVRERDITPDNGSLNLLLHAQDLSTIACGIGEGDIAGPR